MDYQYFPPDFVKGLSERERWLLYERVKKSLRERNVSFQEYDRITDIVIKELEL